MRFAPAGEWLLPKQTAPPGAVELLRDASDLRDEFSLVLLDLVMPGTGGFEALELLLKINPGIPILLISSDHQPGDITRSRALGAAGYLTKPVRRKDLITLVSEVLRRNGQEAVHEPVSSAAPVSKTQTGGRVMNILVAEDSEDNRFLVGGIS